MKFFENKKALPLLLFIMRGLFAILCIPLMCLFGRGIAPAPVNNGNLISWAGEVESVFSDINQNKALPFYTDFLPSGTIQAPNGSAPVLLVKRTITQTITHTHHYLHIPYSGASCQTGTHQAVSCMIYSPAHRLHTLRRLII